MNTLNANKKILIIGAQSPYAIENYYIKHFEKLDLNVDTFFAQNIFLDYYQKNLINKIQFRLGLSSIINNINKELILFFNEIKPEIVLIFKGMEIKASTLSYFKSKGAKLINYNPDHPFIFHGRGSGNKNVKKGIKYFDLYATYSKKIKIELEEKFKVKSFWLPFGYELNDQNFENYCDDNEINEACFVGSPDKERAAFINELIKENISVNVYGNGWDKWLESSEYLKIHPSVFHDELWRVLRKYRVQLNLFRPHNKDSHNMRTFEVPAVGGIMLAPSTQEHSLFFNEGSEAFYFQDLNECISMLKTILSLDKARIDKIRDNARKRSLNSNYSYKFRAQQLLSEILN